MSIFISSRDAFVEFLLKDDERFRLWLLFDVLKVRFLMFRLLVFELELVVPVVFVKLFEIGVFGKIEVLEVEDAELIWSRVKAAGKQALALRAAKPLR